MIKDMTNTYYTKLMEALKFDYEKISGSQKYVETPPSFPSLYFKQLGAEDTLLTLSGKADGNNLAYEVQIYSNKSNTEARNIANAVRKIMCEDLDFTCTYFQPVENVGTTSINRFVTRFTKLETTKM